MNIYSNPSKKRGILEFAMHNPAEMFMESKVISEELAKEILDDSWNNQLLCTSGLNAIGMTEDHELISVDANCMLIQ